MVDLTRRAATGLKRARYLPAAIWGDAFVAALDGHLDEVWRAREQLRAFPMSGSTFRYALLQHAALYQGVLDEPQEDETHRAWAAMFAIFKAVTRGPDSEARAFVDREVMRRAGISSDHDATFVGMDLLMLLGAVRLKHRAAAALFRKRHHATTMVTSGLMVGIAGPVSMARMLGDAALLLDDPADARACYEKALVQMEAMRNRPELALSRLSLAEVLLARYPRRQAVAHEHLDQAIGEFKAMNMPGYLARALELRAGSQPSSELRASGPDGLSEREIEVVRLVAAGQSNREIADELVLSIRTVERHIANVYAKAGIHSKAQATDYAHRHGLT
jgi:DNA-binding CsgD family transcriptional regulator